ncbi:hypothetical protein G4L39_13630 [Limisphaera ngatamarikiensis]|uniref:Uncharacterized protein n=2 Tax=Limisphaera ngatamarikiensis TaxID=1324935 RepID=A0A6M1RS43_9BACT|nr:hypothetical protein [Limisphaera ngatamarikiensis]
MSAQTERELLAKLRGAHARAGRLYKRQLLDQAVSLLGHHRKAAGGLPADRRPVRRRAGAVDQPLPADPQAGAEATARPAQTPWARVLAAAEVSTEARARLQALHATLNPFRLARDIERQK